MTGQAGLRRFVARPDAPDAARAPRPAARPETCDLCGALAGPGHGHVADLESSSLACACRACYLLFTGPDAGGARRRAVPRRYLRDDARPVTPDEWERLAIPVSLVFFLHGARLGRVSAFYPSPAGVTECLLDLTAWAALAGSHPLLASAAPDVEAVLISRTSSGVESFVVPVDICYELAGRIRTLWRGFDGGGDARQAVAEFLQEVRARARDLDEEP